METSEPGNLDQNQGVDTVCCEKVHNQKRGGTRKTTKPFRVVEEQKAQQGDVNLLSLLYASTYFLNTQWSKSVVVGYCPETFQLKIVLNDSENRQRGVFSQFEWGGFYYSLEKIMKIAQAANNELIEVTNGLKQGVNSYTKQRVKITPTFSVVVEQNLREVCVVFHNSYNGHRTAVSLTFNEWCRLYTNMDFLNTLSEHLKFNAVIVISYFEQYILRCVESVTESCDFFSPPGFSPSEINMYKRLYYEFPLLCKNNIHRLITMEKRARGIIK